MVAEESGWKVPGQLWWLHVNVNGVLVGCQWYLNGILMVCQWYVIGMLPSGKLTWLLKMAI